MTLTPNQRMMLLAAAASDLIRVAHGWVSITNRTGRRFPGLATNALLRHGWLEQVGVSDADGRPTRVRISAAGKAALTSPRSRRTGAAR